MHPEALCSPAQKNLLRGLYARQGPAPKWPRDLRGVSCSFELLDTGKPAHLQRGSLALARGAQDRAAEQPERAVPDIPNRRIVPVTFDALADAGFQLQAGGAVLVAPGLFVPLQQLWANRYADQDRPNTVPLLDAMLEVRAAPEACDCEVLNFQRAHLFGAVFVSLIDAMLGCVH